MKKVKKILKKLPYNKKKTFNFVTKKKTNFQHIIKAENSVLFRCLLLTKYLIYRKQFKKMISFFKPQKCLKTTVKFKEKNDINHLNGLKNRKMTYSYKMFKFIKHQNRSKSTIKKDYLLGNYSFFYLFFLFKNLNSDEQTGVLKKKIYNFLKINFNIIATKSELINKGPKAFKFLFFLLKMQQNKKNTIKKKKTLRKNIFFRLKFNKKKLKKLNRKKNAIMRIRHKKKILFRKIMKLTFGSKRHKIKKKKSVKKLINGRVWLRKRAYIYSKRIRRSKARRRKIKKRRRLRRSRRHMYKKTKYIRRRLRLLAHKRNNFFKQKKSMYQYFKKYGEIHRARTPIIGKLKINSTYKKQKKTKKLLRLKAPFFFFFETNNRLKVRKMRKWKLFRLWKQNHQAKKKKLKKSLNLLKKDFNLLKDSFKSNYDNKKLDYFNQMLGLFIKKLVLVKMRNGKKEKALKILTDCCFYLKKYNVTLKKNISFLDFFKKIFFNLQPTMKKKYVYYGRRKEFENSSLNNSRLDVQQLRLPINWIYESLSQDPRKMLSFRLFEELWSIYSSFDKSKTYLKKQEFYQIKIWKGKKF